MSTITSANSVFSITVAGLFPVPQQLHGYSADRAWESENVALAETIMGIDGVLSSGFIYSPYPQNISLQADSSSRQIFQQIAAAMKAAKDSRFLISGTIDLPSTGESFICTRGTLVDFKPLPDAGKVLQAMSFKIVWQSIDATLS